MTGSLNKWRFSVVVMLFFVQSFLPVAVLAWHSSPTSRGARQERILLMRHAEKPDNENDPNLAPAGFKRAENLPKYILDHFGRPDYIFASSNSKHSSRPYETALPLAKVTGVEVDTSFKDDDYGALADALLRDKRFAGKFIVVIWHHGHIPDLAQALQAKDGDYPEKWKSSIYNQVLQFDYLGKHHPVVTQHTEEF